MLLRFHITITKTTETCPTAVSFSLDTCRMKTQKQDWHNSTCVAFSMYARSVHRIVASKHWKCNANGITPNVFLCFHSTTIERKWNRGWASLRCLQNCNVKTQQQLDNYWMLTPSSVLELHLSLRFSWLIETGWNHWKRKANKNCPNAVLDVRKNRGIQGFQTTPGPPRRKSEKAMM